MKSLNILVLCPESPKVDKGTEQNFMERRHSQIRHSRLGTWTCEDGQGHNLVWWWVGEAETACKSEGRNSKIRMKIAIFIRVFAYAYPLLYGIVKNSVFMCQKWKIPDNLIDLRLRRECPFKYTDGKEIHCTLGGHLYGRKSKYSYWFCRMIIHEAETFKSTRNIKKYSISDHTIRTWSSSISIRVIQGLEPTHSNNTYSREYKASLVEEYQKSDEKLEEFAIRHGLRGRTQLSQWIMGIMNLSYDHRSGKEIQEWRWQKDNFWRTAGNHWTADKTRCWRPSSRNITMSAYNQVTGWYRSTPKAATIRNRCVTAGERPNQNQNSTELDHWRGKTKLLKARLHQQEWR